MFGKKGKTQQGLTYSGNLEVRELYERIQAAPPEVQQEFKSNDGKVSLRIINPQHLDGIVADEGLPLLFVRGECTYLPEARCAMVNFGVKDELVYDSEEKGVTKMLLSHLETHFGQPTFKSNNILTYYILKSGITNMLLIGIYSSKAEQEKSILGLSFWDVLWDLIRNPDEALGLI